MTYPSPSLYPSSSVYPQGSPMARTNVPVTPITRTGIAPATEVTGDPTNNHVLVNDGATFIVARNAHATVAQTVTVNFGYMVDGQAITPRVYSIAATATKWMGPFPVAQYGAQLNHDVSTTDIKLTAYKLAG